MSTEKAQSLATAHHMMSDRVREAAWELSALFHAAGYESAAFSGEWRRYRRRTAALVRLHAALMAELRQAATGTAGQEVAR